MDKSAFETYIHEHIPITKAMDIRVMEFSSEKVILRASLDKNINHRDSAFGGSISSLLIMAAWSKIYKLLEDHNLGGTIVIQSSQVTFLAPITADFDAEVDELSEEEEDRFLKTLHKFRKARLKLSTSISSREKELARLGGDFVVFLNSETTRT